MIKGNFFVRKKDSLLRLKKSELYFLITYDEERKGLSAQQRGFTLDVIIRYIRDSIQNKGFSKESSNELIIDILNKD